MSQPAKFTVLRPFYIGNDVVKRGEIVEIDDRHLLSELLNCRKVEPTAETAAMLRSKPTLAFSAMNDSERQQWQPPQPGNMMRPMRN